MFHCYRHCHVSKLRRSEGGLQGPVLECAALSEQNEALLKDLLLIIDDSGAGQVTMDELQDVLGEEAGESTATFIYLADLVVTDKTMMLDIDGDGTVTYEEMCTVMGQMKAKKSVLPPAACN